MVKERGMKEKIDAYIHSWKFCIHLNVIFLLLHIVGMIFWDFDMRSLAGITFSSGMIVITLILDLYDKEHEKDRELISALDRLIANMVKESETQKSNDTDK